MNIRSLNSFWKMILLAVFVSEGSLLNAQTDEERKYNPALGWYYGMNMGSTLPSGHSASFYNGSENNENKLSRILNNTYYKTQIVQAIGYNYLDYDLPAQMGYKPNFTVGGYARYQFTNRSSFMVQANYARLTATDIFLLNLDVPQGFSFDATYLECSIMGQEERTYIDLGYRFDVPSQSQHNTYLEIGINMNNTKVLKNMIQIETLEYNIKYVGEQPTGPYGQDPEYDIYQGGIGFGGFFSAGYSLRFNEKITLDPVATVYFTQTQLEGYNELKPGFNLMFRFTFRDFDFTAQD